MRTGPRELIAEIWGCFNLGVGQMGPGLLIGGAAQNWGEGYPDPGV